MDDTAKKTSTPADDRPAHTEAALADVRIDATIGDDPAELAEIADAVVRGCCICHAEIKSLRKLIEAVQAHPDAKLAPPRAQRREDWKPPAPNDPNELTALEMQGGLILNGHCRALDVRLVLTCSSLFGNDVSFSNATFAAFVSFDHAVFHEHVLFRDARFSQGASFYGGIFERGAVFTNCNFRGFATFSECRMAWVSWFQATEFAEEVWFAGADFAADAHFEWASFDEDAWFGGATFAGNALFDGSTFAVDAAFDGARFAKRASFTNSRIVGELGGDFRRALLRTVEFGELATKSSGGEESAGRTGRKLRERSTQHFQRIRKWWGRGFGWQTVRGLGQLSILSRVSLVALVAIPVIVAFWPAVQAAAGAYHRYAAESHAAMDRALVDLRRAAEADAAVLPESICVELTDSIARVSNASQRWQAKLEASQPDEPLHIGATLACTFLAAVAVTLGLLIYQVFAPEDVRKHDLDAFIDRAHRRYPEDAKDRDDGLRRAIDHLEQIAKRRPDWHPNFVKHHGDTIWVPPRDRIEWFEDPEDDPAGEAAAYAYPADYEIVPSGTWGPSIAGKGSHSAGTEEPAQGEAEDAASRAGLAAAAISGAGNSKTATSEPRRQPERRFSGVPGAERRRIVIEEGARAEYWLKSRENIAAAWASFVLYMIGVGLLLAILGIQIINVLDAAGWV